MKALLLVLGAALTACTSAVPVEEAFRPKPPDPSVQALPEAQFNAWVLQRREQIAQEKAAAEKRYRDAGFVCWQRFAVNDCLRHARKERRTVLDAARKEELGVNAAERDRQTRERLHELARKQKASD